MIIENIEQFYSVLITILTLIGFIIAFVKSKDLSELRGTYESFVRLMNPFIDMDAKQTAVMKEIPPETYKMDYSTLKRLFDELHKDDKGIIFDKLINVISDIENRDVEYILNISDGEDVEQKYVFVSYGHYTIATVDEIKEIIEGHGVINTYYLY